VALNTGFCASVPISFPIFRLTWIGLLALSTAALGLTFYVVARRLWPSGGRGGALSVASIALPLSVMPNAGYPSVVHGRNVYLSSPDYLRDYAAAFVEAGAAIVGGCCGTTPEHIRQIRLAVQGLAPSAQRLVSPAGPAVDAASVDASPVPRAEKSALGRALQEGRRVVAVELEPPKGHDAAAAIADACRFAAHGVDLVTVSDGLRSGARMSALSLAVNRQIPSLLGRLHPRLLPSSGQ
jgi:hypothetical protein